MSSIPRFFISPDQVHGREAVVSGEDLRHIRTVLRMRPGDRLVLLDGAGREYRAVITALERDRVVSAIESESRREPLRPRVTLGQGIAKSDKMDWVVQKATELGASSVVPLVTERTIVKVRDEAKRVARWRKIAREAAMQCGRPDLLSVGPVTPLAEFLAGAAPAPDRLLLFPWEERGRPLKEVLRGVHGVDEVIVLIGPEGGFSPGEAVRASERGFHHVSLGPTILRTETAAVAAISMVLYELA